MTTDEAVKLKEHIQRERPDVDVDVRSVVGANGGEKWLVWVENCRTGKKAAVFEVNQ